MSSKHVVAIAMFLVVGWLVGDVHAGAISVGNSTLIGTLDYSDTFTTSANGGNAARVDGQVPVADQAAAALVENCYGNPVKSWPYPSPTASWVLYFGNFATDATAPAGDWPGGSNAGSATGMTQSGGVKTRDFGLAYDLRNKYVVQFDAVHSGDRVNITTGETINAIAGAHGLSVFFRNSGTSGAQIGLYNSAVGEKDTGFTSGITTSDWYNLAVAFDLDNGSLDIYVDEVHRGQVDLKTFESGSFWNQVDASTNDYVNVGWSEGALEPTRVRWTDNFQVGAPVPEPSTLALLATGLVGLLCYAWRKRK